jgi:hypothetical protein
MKKENGFSSLIGIAIVVATTIVLVGGVFGYQYLTQPKDGSQDQNQQTACTMEAKVCSDGSAVGRSGPNCEFAECPAVQDKYFSIPELNIKFKINDEIKDLVYLASDKVGGGYSYKSAILSTESLTRVSEGGCGLNVAGETALGEVIIVEKLLTEPMASGPRILYKGDNFYVYYYSPQSVCVSNGQIATTLLQKQLNALHESLKTVEPINK